MTEKAELRASLVICTALALACESGDVPHPPSDWPELGSDSRGADSIAHDFQHIHPDALDSMVLESTPCLGDCPVYRVRINRDGETHLTSYGPPDSGKVIESEIGTAAVEQIASLAEQVDFFTLPTSIREDTVFCVPYFTDHPTAIVTVFLRHRYHRVEDNRGCGRAPSGLRNLETAIERLIGIEHWSPYRGF